MNNFNATESTFNEKKSREVHCPPSKTSLQAMELNTNKAGMEGLDISKINEIIQKASEGSKFFLHKQKCQERIDSKIAHLKSLIEKFSKEQIAKAEQEMTVLSQEMESTNDLSRTIVHIDMDMFYAAVEMRDDPSLRDKPMAVGGNSMLSTSNYAARKFGVRAGMAGFIGKKLCPDLIIVPTNFDKYKKVSRQIQEIFQEYDPEFSPMSLDEAFLDITDYLINSGKEYEVEVEFGKTVAEAVVEEMRKKIYQKTDLTASAGIAVNTRLAKVCSDLKKPNGQFYLPPYKEEIDKFIQNLPIRKISGIGNVTEQQLKGIGVVTCSDLWEHRGLIKLLFSESSYTYFLRIALGMGSTEVSPSTESDRKSISTETTFSGTADRVILLNLVTELCKDLKLDMVKMNLYGKVFTLKMKTTNFEVRTRAQSLFEPTQDESVMISVAHKLLISEIENETKNPPLSVRLLGVRMSNLCNKSQLDSKKQTKITELFGKSRLANKCNQLNYNEKLGFRNESPECEQNFVDEFDDFNDFTSDLTYDDEFLEKFPSCSKAKDSNLTEQNECSLSADGATDVHEFSAKDSENIEFVCPVCCHNRFSNMDELNSHIDLCLNQGLVKELVKESNSLCSSQSGSQISSSPAVRKTNKRKIKDRSNSAKKQKNDKSSRSAKVLHKFLGLK